MYINDPFDLTLLPKLEGEEIEEEEERPPTNEEIFYTESRFRPGTLPYHNNFAVDVCRFDEQGHHTTMAKNCPHYESEDEEGQRVKTGWTVQMNHRHVSAAGTSTGT